MRSLFALFVLMPMAAFSADGLTLDRKGEVDGRNVYYLQLQNLLNSEVILADCGRQYATCSQDADCCMGEGFVCLGGHCE